jgi:dolichyl-phosphate-mannose--protein O-mannosyl transferase
MAPVTSRDCEVFLFALSQRLLSASLQNFWVKDHRQIYLLGNPFIWFLSTASIVGYVAVRGFLILRAQRGFRDFESSTQHSFPVSLPRSTA